MTRNVICGCCNKSFKTQLMLKCSVCQKFFNNQCMSITMDELRILSDVDKGYEWSCINCRAFGSQLKDLRNMILSLQNDIQSLKDELASKPSGTTSVDMEEIIEEINERSKRKRNLIIYGLPEQDQKLKPEERIVKDMNDVDSVLRVIEPGFKLGNEKTTRLGRFSSDKKRPVKIKFATEDEVINFIRKANI